MHCLNLIFKAAIPRISVIYTPPSFLIRLEINDSWSEVHF